MKFSILNAFVDSPLSGNPAAVCFLQTWLPDEVMRKLAQQFGYSETAFLIQEGKINRLRWFTPRTEVDLCGHATMAAAHAILATYPHQESLAFETRSGVLSVRKDGDRLVMDFPLRQVDLYEGSIEELERCLNTSVVEAAIAGPTILAVVSDELAVREVAPDLERIKSLPFNALIPTAAGYEADFVSRFFGPRIGIPEDPVTGAAHTGLAPFWSKRLEKSKLKARQLSPRGGSILCELIGHRVLLSGKTELFAQGELYLNGD